MSYAVKELFPTLQGEGHHTGRPAVFIRFTGCNLWTGREEDRTKAVCKFCDTDFIGTDGSGGGSFATAESLAKAGLESWHQHHAKRPEPFVVLTGGEPLLQVDAELIDALHGSGFTIAIETNGTKPVPKGIDWICVSPKGGAELIQQCGDELKIVFPQEGITPSDYEHLDFTYFFLQPMDAATLDENTEAVRAFCEAHPKWKVSLQTHKLLGIP